MMIELINISKSYQSKTGRFHALKDVSLSIHAGEIYGVIGKSGAGKSSLIRCVNFLEKPSSGTVKIDGHDLSTLTTSDLRKTRHKIGMVFQNFNLLSQRSVYQNIALPLELIGYSKADIAKSVMPLLEFTGLSEKRDSYPSELSGGQKQRVAIARAMASNPKILLCDEPTSALDQQTTNSILQLFKDINQQFGVTIFIITHEIDVIKQLCDRVALIHQGELIEQGEIYEIFSNPKNQLTQQIVKSSLKQELPASIQQQLASSPGKNSNAVLRIMFHGKAAAEPFIANIMQNLNIKLSILQANIELLKNDTLGIMISEVIDHSGNLESGITYLKQNGLEVEVIGYVNRHA